MSMTINTTDKTTSHLTRAIKFLRFKIYDWEPPIKEAPIYSIIRLLCFERARLQSLIATFFDG